MKTRNIYIFNALGGAAIYGIGTYVKELIACLKDISSVQVTLVMMDSDNTIVRKEQNDGYNVLYLPFVVCDNNMDRNLNLYYRNVSFLLKQYIPDSCDNIFQLNHKQDESLAYWLKKQFQGKFIIAIHFTPWNLGLKGDTIRLKQILSKRKEELSDPIELYVANSVERSILQINNCDRVICIAKHSFDFFYNVCMIPFSKLCLINNALADVYPEYSKMSKQELKQKYKLGSYTKIILFTGRIDELKGVVHLINAFQNILEIYNDCRLVFAGTGDFTSLISASDSCWSKVSFTGFLEKQQLYELYRIADIGIVCSLYEEFGFSAIEMMMFEIPLIVTDVFGLAEIIIDNESGLKVPVVYKDGKRIVDEKILSDKIEILLTDAKLRKRIGRNARKHFLEKYESHLFTQKMIELYTSI